MIEKKCSNSTIETQENAWNYFEVGSLDIRIKLKPVIINLEKTRNKLIYRIATLYYLGFNWI